MRHLLITQPAHLCVANVTAVRRYVAEFNAKILIGEEHPTNTGFVQVREMLGDPNQVFSTDVEELLVSEGILVRQLWRNARGNVVTLDDSKEQVFTVAWGSGDFCTLSAVSLLRVGWDLRRVPGFCNAVLVSDEVNTALEVDETVPDEVDEEEQPHVDLIAAVALDIEVQD